MRSARIVPIVRRRARKPKVKTGCLTCKQRRIKCDEGFPACSKCTKTGRKCDGYGSEVKTEDNPSPNDQVGFLDPITRLPFSFPCEDGQERRAFQYFCTNTASEIAGFLPSDFWNRLILQASHTDPAILHAVIALGSIHETYERDTSRHLKDDDFALVQSTKAIRHLRTQLSMGVPRSGESVLLSCILFICLETFQGNHEAALAHLESGLKILSSWLHDKDKPLLSYDFVSRPTRRFLEEELVPLFTRLDVQATAYLTSRSLKEVHPHSSTEAPVIPTRFTSLTDANNHLAEAVHWMLYSNNAAHNMMYWMVNNPLARANLRPPPTAPGVIPKIPDIVLKKILKIETQNLRILQLWLDCLTLFLREHPNLSAKDLRGAAMLKILYYGTICIQTASLYNHEMEYDKHIQDFERVITLSEFLIKSKNNATDNEKPLYSFEMNILPPLHYCSTRCRDPKLRRRALTLLEDSPRREGMWDSAMLAAIARYVVEEEEAGIEEVKEAKDVPASARICILDKIPMLEDKSCVIRYCKGVRNPYAELEISEVLITYV